MNLRDNRHVVCTWNFHSNFFFFQVYRTQLYMITSTCVFETELTDGSDREDTWDWRSPEDREVLHIPPPRDRGVLQTPPPSVRGSLRLE